MTAQIHPAGRAVLAEKPRAIAYVGAGLLAQLLDVSETTIWEWVRKGHLPKPVKIGGSTRWRWSDVENRLQGAQSGADEDPILRASRGA